MDTTITTGDQRPATTVLTDPAAVLAGMFTDPRFRELNRYRLFANIDGIKIGVVLATKSPRYDNFALNKTDMERLLAGKRNGKIDQAFVVMARVSDIGALLTYVDWIEAERLHDMLKGMRPRNGVFGEFWTLPPSITTAGIVDPNDEPF
jgi:hypothetical protein